MTAPLRGDDLAYAALDYIRDHPGEWDQRYYFCGSTACFAGRVVLLGLGLDTRQLYRRIMPFASNIFETARDLLGWTEHQALYVFSYQTTGFIVLEETVKDVLNGDIT